MLDIKVNKGICKLKVNGDAPTLASEMYVAITALDSEVSKESGVNGAIKFIILSLLREKKLDDMLKAFESREG